MFACVMLLGVTLAGVRSLYRWRDEREEFRANKKIPRSCSWANSAPILLAIIGEIGDPNMDCRADDEAEARRLFPESKILVHSARTK